MLTCSVQKNGKHVTFEVVCFEEVEEEEEENEEEKEETTSCTNESPSASLLPVPSVDSPGFCCLC